MNEIERIQSETDAPEKIYKNFEDFEREKEKKLLNLIVEIITKATLKEHYETSD